MDIVMVQSLIDSVGFPIVVCIALFYQNWKTQESYNKTFSEFKEVINHNSNSIDKLSEIVTQLKKGGA